MGSPEPSYCDILFTNALRTLSSYRGWYRPPGLSHRRTPSKVARQGMAKSCKSSTPIGLCLIRGTLPAEETPCGSLPGRAHTEEYMTQRV